MKSLKLLTPALIIFVTIGISSLHANAYENSLSGYLECIDYNVQMCEGGGVRVAEVLPASQIVPDAIASIVRCTSSGGEETYVTDIGCYYNDPYVNNPFSEAISSAQEESTVCGSVIKLDSRTLEESIPIVGTPFSLNYSSARVPADDKKFKIKIPLSIANVDPDISSIAIKITVAGRTFDNSYMAPFSANQTHEFTWDGLDNLMNPVYSPTRATVEITRSYQPTPSTRKTHQAFDFMLGYYNPSRLGLAGWTINSHHALNVAENRVYLGNGNFYESTPLAITGGFQAPSPDKSEVYEFNTSGLHIKTLYGLTGATKYEFTYDGSGRLVKIEDAFGIETIFNRNGSGVLTSIVAPHGQTTSITVDGNGWLATVTNPNSGIYELSHSASGLLTTFEKPRGQVATFTYSNGKLVSDSNSAGNSTTLSQTVYPSTGQRSTLATSQMGRNDVSTFTPIPGGYSISFNKANGEWRNTYQTHAASRLVNTNGFEYMENYLADVRFHTVDFPSSGTFSIPGTGLGHDFSNSQSVTYQSGAGPFAIDELTTTRTVNSKTTTNIFDGSAKTFTSITPVGRTFVETINNHEQVVSQQFGNLTPVEFEYDTEGRLVEINQGARSTAFTFNTGGLISSITDPLNKVTSYSYDSGGRVTQITLPDSRTIGLSYDANGNLTQIGPPGRPNHTYTFHNFDIPSTYQPPTLTGISVNTQYSYNNDKQLVEIQRPDGQDIEFSYDTSTGKLTQMATPLGTYTYGYQWHLLQEATGLDGIRNSYWFDGTFVKDEALTDPNTNDALGSISRWRNGEFQLTALQFVGFQNTSSAYTSFSYDNDGLLVTAGDLTLTRSTSTGLVTHTDLGDTAEDFTYDTFGALDTYTGKYNGTTIYTYDLSRDGSGRINGFTETVGGVTTTYSYTYDNAGRLVDVDKNSSSHSDFTYDTNSNRVSGTRGGVAFNATVNNQDWLLTHGNYSYTYNENGDLTSRTDSTTSTTINFTYDALGALRQVAKPTLTVNYKLDGLGRRAVKLHGSTVIERYLYIEGTTLGAVLDSAGVVTKSFVYATQSHSPDYMVFNGEKYRFFKDHLGSIRLVVKISDGSIAQAISYDEFGRVLSDTNPGFQPFGFAGGLYDHDTGLVRFGARDYDAEIGRWLSKDPILFAGGDTNLYGYVLNDPINWIDPTGEVLVAPIIGGALIGGGVDLGMQLIQNGGDIRSVNWTSVGTSAAIGGALGGVGRIFGPFSPKGLPKGVGRLRQHFRFDPPHHGKGWHFDGTIGKNLHRYLPPLLLTGDQTNDHGAPVCSP